jgi:MFS family permease
MSFLRNLDRRFKVMLGAIGVYNWTRSLPAQYDQLYVTALGANPLELGSLNSVAGAVNAIIGVPMGWLADKYGVKKVIVFGLLLSILGSAIYCLAVDWLTLIPGIILTQIGMQLIIPLTDIIFIGTTSLKQRATAIGFTRALWALPCTVAPLVAAFLVVTFGGITAQGIRPLYIISLALYLGVFLTVLVKLKPLLPRQTSSENPPDKTDAESGSNAAGFIEDFKELFRGEKWLKRWIIISSIRNLGQRVLMPFVPLWMVNVKRADPIILGIIGAVGIITWVVFQIPAGRLTDKIGRKKAYFLLQPILLVGTLWLILAPNPESLIVVGLLGAIGLRVGTEGSGIGGLSFTPFTLMSWEMVPAEKRGRWHGIMNMFNVLSIPVTLLGGFLWQQGYMMQVLLIPIVLDVLIMPVLLTVPETLSRST